METQPPPATDASRPSLTDMPPEILNMILAHLCSRGPMIIYLKGHHERSTESCNKHLSIDGHATVSDDPNPQVLAIRGVAANLKLVCRQFYLTTNDFVNKFPLLLRVERGVRLSTTQKKLGCMALARVGDLRVTFQQRTDNCLLNESYYSHFFDLSDREIRDLLPAVTKITLIAPVGPGHTADVRRFLEKICNGIAAKHPTVRQLGQAQVQDGKITLEVRA